MKHLLLLFIILLLCPALPAKGQEKEEARTFTLKMVNKRGKPIKNTDILYQIEGTPGMGKTSKDGLLTIDKVADSDTIYILAQGYDFRAIPVAGNDSLQLILTKSGEADQEEVNLGYQTVSNKNSTQPVTQLKPSKQSAAYSDLASYLQGRSGIQIKGSGSNAEVIIRGGASSLQLSSGALIVVDGIVYDSFGTVNSMYNVTDIKSVDVLKDGSIYGSRGANGVVVITTKRGKE